MMKRVFTCICAVLYATLGYSEVKEIKVDGVFYSIDTESLKATVISGFTSWYEDPDGTRYREAGCYDDPTYNGNVVIPESVYYEGNTYIVTSIMGNGWDFHNKLSSAFRNCKDLETITIPKTVSYIGCEAFMGCTSLKAVNITDLGAWCSIDYYPRPGDSFGLNNPLYYAHDLYLNGEKINNLVLPDTISSVSKYSFIGGSFSTITFSKSFNTIGEYSFSNCDNLKDVTCWAEEVPMTDRTAFDNSYIEERVTLHVPYGAIDNYKAVAPWKNFKEIVAIDGSEPSEKHTLSFPDLRIDDVCYAISVELSGNEVTSGVVGVVEAGNNKKDVVVADSVTFGISYYQGCYILGSDQGTFVCQSTLPVTYIGFIGHDINSITIPKTVTGIHAEIFKYSPSLQTIIVDKDNPVLDSRDNSNCIIETSTNTLLAGCKGSVILEGVLVIAEKAFYGCKDITKIEIPATVTTIGEQAFANIDKLTDVTCWADEVPTTDRTAFENSYIEDYVMLHVPALAMEKYKEKAPWKNFKEIVALGGTEPLEKCSVPTIDYREGKLVVNCDTEGAEYVTTITSDDFGEHQGHEVEVSATYNISAYAKAEGYANSDVVTATLCWIEVEGTPTKINESIESKTVLIQSQGGSILVKGKNLGGIIEVYNAAGLLLGSANAVDGTTTISTNLKAGDIALVKIGKKTVKITIR